MVASHDIEKNEAKKRPTIYELVITCELPHMEHDIQK